MNHVPVVVPPPAASANATELGKQLTETITRFRQENPNLSATEIHQALSLAWRGAGISSSRPNFITLFIFLLILILGIFLLLYLAG